MPQPATEPRDAQSIPPGKRITDIDHLVQLLSQWEGRFEQLSCGRFESTFLMARGRSMQAHLATVNQSILIRGREGPAICTVSLVVPASADCVWHLGRLDAGSLVVRRGDGEVNHRTSKHAVNLTMSVAEEKLRMATRALKQTDPHPTSWVALKPPPELFTALEDRLHRFILGLGQPSSIDSQDGRVLEHECLTAVVEAMFPATNSRRIDLPLPARVHLVHRAEDLLRGRLRTPTSEIDLCDALGVSGRTLRLAFRERFGLGPMAYYQTLRLNAARTVLKTAAPGELSVAQVARDFGFSHLGKFAGYYRRLFGEKPSTTKTGRVLSPWEIRSEGCLWG